MKISAVIITFNEEDRLPEALASLQGVADEIVVVDSYSTDRTPEIARQARTIFYQNQFQDFGAQKNFAMSKASHEWVMNLDADERLSPELAAEIKAMKTNGWPEAIAGFSIKRKTYYLGRWINHSGWYPDNKIRLFSKASASWHGKIHERLLLNGKVGQLPGHILHFTYRDIGDHVRRINNYSSMLAAEIIRKKTKFLGSRLCILPAVTFFKHYFLKFGFLDGFAGVVIALLSSWATALKYLKALELKNKTK